MDAVPQTNLPIQLVHHSGPTALLIAGIAVALLAAVLVFNQYGRREEAVALNIRHIEQNDRMFAEHVGHSLDAVDILLDEMRITIQKGKDWHHWTQGTGHQLLSSRLSRALPQVRYLSIFDAKGTQRYTSFTDAPPAINISDRPYFNTGEERTHFGPFIDRNTNRPTYSLARPLGDGKFEGTLMAAVETSYFEEFCRSSRPYSEFEAAIVTSDARIVAACNSRVLDHGTLEASPGDDFRQVMANGSFISAELPNNRNITENDSYVLATEPVPDHPDLRIVSITPRDLLVRDWRQQAIHTAILGGLALLTLIAAGLLIRRHIHEHAELTAELQHSNETLEDRVKFATEELEKRRHEVEHIAEAKTRFFAAASHDLRQPLHAMQLFLTDLFRIPQSDEQRVLVERINTAAKLMNTQLRSLLEFSRLDMASIVPENRRTSLDTIFTQLSTTYLNMATANNVKLIFRSRNVILETDPALLSRLVGNLIDNAIKFAPNGRILVCARRRSNSVRIEVRDNGCGIQPAYQSQIFDEFFQIKNRAREHNAGQGLGLAIALRIASLLGSNVNLRSEVGHGSCFTITLPCVHRNEALETDEKISCDPDAPHLVVIAGANLDAANQFTERAVRWGYHVRSAHSLDAAWRMLAREKGIPIIMHSGNGTLSASYQLLLRRHPGVVITNPETNIPELGPYLLREPVKPARLRALLRSLH